MTFHNTGGSAPLRLPQLRVAVNSRCGRACFYCRPSGEGLVTDPLQSLTADNVLLITSLYAEFGGQFIKLTGGDPALWSPLLETVARLKRLPGLRQVEVISRHPRIGDLAPALAGAGVDVINISLDTLQPSRHRRITGIDDLAAVLDALRTCARSVARCKVNTVVMRGVNDDELEDLVAFCEGAGIATLKLLDVIRDLDSGGESFAGRLQFVGATAVRDLYVPLWDVAERFRDRAVRTHTATQGGLGHPMTVLVLESGLELVFKDHLAGAWYGPICRGCRHYPCHDALMALRLTADLRLQFCLLGDEFSLDMRPHLDAGPWAVRHVLGEALRVYDAATFHAPSAPADTPHQQAAGGQRVCLTTVQR
jgi:cyclic pyranopterin phosphate synthase